jgi:hypothetical protein
MNDYKLINNTVECIKEDCEEITARGADASAILTVLDDATKGSTPFDYDLSGVRAAADALDEKYDFVSDLTKDIRRYCSDVNIRRAHLQEDYRWIYNIVNKTVGKNLSEQIAKDLIANGVKIEKD